MLLGAWQLGNPGPRSQKVGIAWVKLHPAYSWKKGARADIALVHLEHAIQFSERILPICLPDSSVHLLPDTNCWVAGWGSIHDGGVASFSPGVWGWVGTEGGGHWEIQVPRAAKDRGQRQSTTQIEEKTGCDPEM